MFLTFFIWLDVEDHFYEFLTCSKCLAVGNHVFPFNVFLAPNLPSSFEGEHGSIRYYVQVVVSLCWTATNPKCPIIFSRPSIKFTSSYAKENLVCTLFFSIGVAKYDFIITHNPQWNWFILGSNRERLALEPQVNILLIFYLSLQNLYEA